MTRGVDSHHGFNTEEEPWCYQPEIFETTISGSSFRTATIGRVYRVRVDDRAVPFYMENGVALHRIDPELDDLIRFLLSLKDDDDG